MHVFHIPPPALMQCAYVGVENAEMFNLLLAHGADVNLTAFCGSHSNGEETGQTALFLAADNGHTMIIERLIEMQADINHQDSNGLTALMIAAGADSGTTEFIEMMLGNNADPSMIDNGGLSAFVYAAETGRSNTANILHGNKGPITIVDAEEALTAHLNSGNAFQTDEAIELPWTLLNFACMKGDDEPDEHPAPALVKIIITLLLDRKFLYALEKFFGVLVSHCSEKYSEWYEGHWVFKKIVSLPGSGLKPFHLSDAFDEDLVRRMMKEAPDTAALVFEGLFGRVDGSTYIGLSVKQTNFACFPDEGFIVDTHVPTGLKVHSNHKDAVGASCEIFLLKPQQATSTTKASGGVLKNRDYLDKLAYVPPESALLKTTAAKAIVEYHWQDFGYFFYWVDLVLFFAHLLMILTFSFLLSQKQRAQTFEAACAGDRPCFNTHLQPYTSGRAENILTVIICIQALWYLYRLNGQWLLLVGEEWENATKVNETRKRTKQVIKRTELAGSLESIQSQKTGPVRGYTYWVNPVKMNYWKHSKEAKRRGGSFAFIRVCSCVCVCICVCVRVCVVVGLFSVADSHLLCYPTPVHFQGKSHRYAPQKRTNISDRSQLMRTRRFHTLGQTGRWTKMTMVAPSFGRGTTDQAALRRSGGTETGPRGSPTTTKE